jgi:hypothetical protein
MSSERSSMLFACSKCFSRHPFEELSAGQQLCKVSLKFPTWQGPPNQIVKPNVFWVLYSFRHLCRSHILGILLLKELSQTSSDQCCYRVRLNTKRSFSFPRMWLLHNYPCSEVTPMENCYKKGCHKWAVTSVIGLV